MQDLASFRPEVAAALATPLGDYTLYSPPPPAGGAMLSLILNVLKGGSPGLLLRGLSCWEPEPHAPPVPAQPPPQTPGPGEMVGDGVFQPRLVRLSGYAHSPLPPPPSPQGSTSLRSRWPGRRGG